MRFLQLMKSRRIFLWQRAKSFIMNEKWSIQNVQFSSSQNVQYRRNKDNFSHATICRIRDWRDQDRLHGITILRDTILHERWKLLRSLRRSIVFRAFQSAVRIIACPTITRCAIRRRPITRVSPLIGISQDRKLVRARKKRQKRKRKKTVARERAWVLARYDAIMRRGLGWGEKESNGRERREKERIGRARMRRKEIEGGDARPGGRRGERVVVLPHWPWLGPKLRWVEVLPGPLVASPSSSSSHRPGMFPPAPRSTSTRTDHGPHRACPVVLHSQTPPSRTSQKVH